MLNKKVCMFVWNHFTNDARVLRECTALSEDRYSVDLISIHDPKDPKLLKFEQRNPNFRVYRVRRYPLLLELLQKGYRFFLKYKLAGLLALAIWGISLYFVPVPILLLTAFLLLLWRTKVRVLWVRGNIFIRMIIRGFQDDYDIYHSNDLNTLLQGYICSKWRWKKKKLIYDSHEVQTSRTGYDSKIYGKIEAFLIKKIDAMIVENHTRAKYNEDLYGFYPYVVHNYPFVRYMEDNNKIDLYELLNIPREEPILLYQGGIQTGRGLDKIIKAAPLFKRGVVVFIGDGRIKPELQKMVEENNLQHKIKFLPKVPVEELLYYTRNAYLGFQVLNNVCFNHYSASSNKLFEYMMCGVPVVACSFPEIKRVVEREYTGVCVDSHDPISIAEGVNYFLDHPEEHAQMKRNCLRARLKYNWEKEKKRFLKVYEGII
jgi:glycosyltransferase involved in cell wall biosynthesis